MKTIPVEATRDDTGHEPDIVRVYKQWDTVREVYAEAKVHYVGLTYTEDFARAVAKATPWLERYGSLMWEIERDGKVVQVGEVYGARVTHNGLTKLCTRCCHFVAADDGGKILPHTELSGKECE